VAAILKANEAAGTEPANPSQLADRIGANRNVLHKLFRTGQASSRWAAAINEELGLSAPVAEIDERERTLLGLLKDADPAFLESVVGVLKQGPKRN
jgi:hypothetical protein